LTKSYNPEKVVIIIGDMLELGEYSNYEHSKIIQLIRLYNFLDVWLIGNEFFKLKDDSGIRFYPSTEEAKIDFKMDQLPINTIIFLKGSRGIAVEKLLG
jgi:UDP-N-acetylmuramoyl-tripeptide--D-alanyl-D-alanine ligase